MNLLINFNGNLIDPKIPVALASNRSLRYGDGLFETMFWDGYQIKNLHFHLDRLFQGLDILHFDLTGGFSRDIYFGRNKKTLYKQQQGCKCKGAA